MTPAPQSPPPGAAPARPARGPVFWGLVLIGAFSSLCCLGTAAIFGLGMVLGEVTDAPSSVGGGGGGGSGWLPAGEKSRSDALTQQLPGGRWVYQNGSGMETVLSRTATTATVRQDSSGAIYELSFDDDGEYTLRWRHASTFMNANTSSADEAGRWALEGTTLTLEPRSQKCRYTNGGLAQEKEDVDLAPRAYRVVDVQLETITTAGVDLQEFPGVELEGPVPAWDLASGQLSLDLQRLR